MATGSTADDNPFRFSTKYFDAESELYYYGYRYYSPVLGRWLTRDPVYELGSVIESGLRFNTLITRKNLSISPLYSFLNNNSIDHIDLLGLKICTPKPGYKPIPNGCGPEKPKWLNLLIPDSYFWGILGKYGYDFTSSCNAHDICYGTCCSDKDKCDKQFLALLKEQCKDWINKLYGPGGILWLKIKIIKEMDKKVCYIDAEAYYSAVAKRGNKAYMEAQKSGCMCTP